MSSHESSQRSTDCGAYRKLLSTASIFSSCLFGLAKGINFTPGYRSGCRLSALHSPPQKKQRFTTILLRRKSKPSDKNKQTNKHNKKSTPARSQFVRDSGEITGHDCGGMFPCFFSFLPNIVYLRPNSTDKIKRHLRRKKQQRGAENMAGLLFPKAKCLPVRFERVRSGFFVCLFFGEEGESDSV